MRIQPEFPEYRYQDPLRQAELSVYLAIANSPVPGQALYEVKTTSHTPQVDFVVYLEGVACFAIQVKGGIYTMENGTLFLHTPDGPKAVPNLLRKTMDGALSIRNAITAQLDADCFVISVLLFPDMAPNPDLIRWADTSRTNVMFGLADLVNRLAQLDDVRAVRFRPTARRIAQEVAILLPDQVETRPAALPEGVPAAPTAHQVVIHVANLYLYTTQLPDLGALHAIAAADAATDAGGQDDAGEAIA